MSQRNINAERTVRANEWAMAAVSAMLSRCLRAVEVERARLALALRRREA